MIASPKLRSTPGVWCPSPAFDPKENERQRIANDHMQAARTATLRQRCMEENAVLSGLTVEQYMRMTNTLPCTDFAERPALMDPIEADHHFAALQATMAQREIEAKAQAVSLTVEEYMEENEMLTDAHLTPWAR